MRRSGYYRAVGVQIPAFLTAAHISCSQFESFYEGCGTGARAQHSMLSFNKEIKKETDPAWKNTLIHIQHVYCENVCIDQTA